MLRASAFLLNQRILCVLTFRRWCQAHPFAKMCSWVIGTGAVPWALCIGRSFSLWRYHLLIIRAHFNMNKEFIVKIKKTNDLQDTVDINIMPFLTDRWNEAKKDEVQSHRSHSQWQEHSSKVRSWTSCPHSPPTSRTPYPWALASCCVNLPLQRRNFSKDGRSRVLRGCCLPKIMQSSVRETSMKAGKEMKHN